MKGSLGSRAASVLVTAAVLGVAGCQSSSTLSTDTSTTNESNSAATDSASRPGDSAAVGTAINITIAAGVVRPSNAEAQAVAGEPIVLTVSSDAPDSIHVHSVPAHVFDVQPLPDQRFEFTVNVPGRVDVELHELNRTILTLTVRPQ